MKTLEKEFLEQGGLRERMTQARIDARRKEAHASENGRPTSKSVSDTISMELVVKMVAWDKERKTLEHWQWNTLKLITEGKYPLEGKYMYACMMNLAELKKAGFEEG